MRGRVAVSCLWAMGVFLLSEDAGASFIHPDLGLSVSADFRSAYISSSGGAVETRPVTSQCLDWSWRMGNYGRFEGYAWIVSALTGQKDELRRRAFNELEAEISYAYDWRILDGWALNNQLGHIWDPGIGYESFDAEAFTHEIHFVQKLSNPYLTPYYDVMYCYHPAPWIRVNTGLQRPFYFLDGRLCIMPKVFVTWGDSNRYEAKFNTKLDGGDVFGFRPMYVNSGIWSTYRLNDRLSFYLRLQMYDVLDEKGRNFENGRSESWAVCDMPFAVIGVTVNI